MKTSLQRGFLLVFYILLNNNIMLNAMFLIPSQLLKHNVLLKRSFYNGIDMYCAQRDNDAIKKIALNDIYKLVSIPISFTQKTLEQEYILKQDAVNNHVMSALTYDTVISKVYRKNDQTIGFITYSVKKTLVHHLLPDKIGSHVIIHHLAIDDAYKGKGYGTLLLHHVIEECKKQNINAISLWITGGSGLDSYYSRFGFECARRTKLNDEMWLKRLQPHPMIIVLQIMVQWIKNKNNEFYVLRKSKECQNK